MKWLAWILLAATSVFAADEAADRAAVDKLISGLQASKAGTGDRAVLLSADIDRGEFEREFAALSTGMIDAGGVWSEVTRPSLLVDRIKFVTPDVALVNGANVQAGSLTMRRIAFVLIARREAGGWKISSLRTLPLTPPPPPPFIITRLL